MKNVWILERFVPTEETKKSIADMMEMMEGCTEEKILSTCKELVTNLEKKQQENSDGYWLGYVGKSNYKDFCYCAKDFMRRHRNDLVKTGIRVVKAQIADGAKYWTGYRNAVVNEGVTKYLYATYNK